MANLVTEEIKNTEDKAIGMLIDGIELYSPSVLNESIYFGEISKVDILNSGKNYDVITPSNLEVLDVEGFGVGAKIYGNMRGKLIDVVVVSPGIGYDKKPNLSLIGGNLSGGVELETNLIKKSITSNFIPSTVGVSLTTITFISDHNFENGEEIIYNPGITPAIVGLVTDSSYYARIINSKTISLYNSSTDALNDNNIIGNLSAPIGITTGVHSFTTRNVKNIIDKIYIKTFEGELYNSSVRIPSIDNSIHPTMNGINLNESYIFAKNHNLKEKDLVVYKSTDSTISGLSTTTQYYVTIVDSDAFRLSDAGSTYIPNDENYKNKVYVNLNSVGVGTHIFSYPPIEIIVSSIPGTTSTVSPTLKPIVLGSFDSIFIEDVGSGYGVNQVVNLNKNPIIQITGESQLSSRFSDEAILQPIIINGKIVDVHILNSGKNYQDNIDIVVDGIGKYAKLYPIIVDGKITEIKILSTGVGYVAGSTRLIAQRRGNGAKFLGNIVKWTINQYFKNKSTIDSSSRNGFVIPSRNIKNSLQFINLYPSEDLRVSIKDEPEFITSNNKSSPVLGWAYDGNPIIGPYLYSNGKVKNIKSSYKLKSNLLTLSEELKRPPSNIFPIGYFIEDYEYDSELSELDEHNGMFITDRPEFPDGTYAYFMTIDDKNSKNPVYPYVIGSSFKNEPNVLNYNTNYNQNIDFESLDYVKNTNPLYLTTQTSGYDYLNSVDEKYKQNVIIKNTLQSSIDEIKILNAGQNYKVGDEILFTVDNSQDIIPNAYISRVNGKVISNVNVGVQTYLNVSFKSENNKIIGITSYPHNIQNLNYTYISNASINDLNGAKKVVVNNKIVNLESNNSELGITTYIKVNDISGFSVDDYLKIDDEIVKIIEIYPQQSEFFVHRLESLGVHTAGVSLVSLLPTKFEFTNFNINSQLSVNNKKYFNPKYSVGLGTTGSNVFNENTNSTYNVPPQAIYIPNHQYSSNQALIYNYVGAGVSGLLVSVSGTSPDTYRLEDGQTVYAINLGRDYLGITTIGFGTIPLFFEESSYNSDEIHYFNQISTSTTGKVELFDLNISTELPHELLDDDLIRLKGAENSKEYHIINIDFNQNYKVKVDSNNSFKLSLYTKPQYIKYAEDNSLDIIPLNCEKISYSTNSNNASGGINDVKIVTSSSLYKKLPIVTNIQSENGMYGNLLPYSNKVGQIDSIQRVKDGFDYPSDITLQPKFGTTVICNVDGIKKVQSVNVMYGGTRYNSSPSLKVIGNDLIKLSANLKNSTVESVDVIYSPNNITVPLEIIPINNSNGYDILNINVESPTINRIQLDINQFPLIYRDYDEPTIDFPFKVSDLIFIENCRVEESNKINYNSLNHSNSFFEVTGINTSMGYIYYSTSNIELNSNEFGTYSIINGYGTVVNKNSMAKFEMILEKNNYINGEFVKALDSENNIKFSGYVMETNGWDANRNQLRLTKTKGNLEVNDVILGNSSLLEGKVLYLNSSSIRAYLGTTRDKINYTERIIEDLNSSLKRIQDSNYYQDFSYSIRSQTPYDVWREPIKSIVHPSGFKEFSDLEIISKPKNKLKLNSINSTLEINLEVQNQNSFFTRSNYTIGYENEKINQNTTERVYFGSGSDLWPVAGYGNTYIQGLELLPYLNNLSNNVIKIKNIDSQFTGTYNYISLGEKLVEFDSSNPNYLGVSTSGLNVGDIVGYSTYNEYPFNTRIVSIGIDSITTLYPHKVYSGVVTESLEFRRNLNNNNLVGINSFRLSASDDTPIYVVSGTISNVNLDLSSIDLPHNFEQGQKVYYENIGGNPIGIVTTNEVIGGISTDVLPAISYVTKLSDNKFKLSGLSTSQTLVFTNGGSGIHKFIFDSPNSSTLITIDNIIQTPLHYRGFDIELSSNVGIGTSTIYVSSGITSITSIDVLKIEDEYLRVISVGIGSTNSIEVERGFLGTEEVDHTGISTISVNRGNYHINEDIIYFTSSPFGLSGLPDLEVSSRFTGRVFSRSFSYSRPNDRNIILDDISDTFIGISSAILKENGSTVVGLYTNTNDPNLINISNNPLILINNVPQESHIDFELEDAEQNTIKFLTGSPRIGKILKYEVNQGYGYMPLVGASATVAVSVAGTISQVYLNDVGGGYRTPPEIKIITPIGYGASISATVGTSGTITELIIENSGSGYSASYPPDIIIDAPLPYYDLDLVYSQQSVGIGSSSKVSLSIGSDLTVKNVELIEVGQNYKVGDILNVVGLTTNVGIGTSFSEFSITVKELVSDTFFGIYPGQFIAFDDISNKFNSNLKEFDLYSTINGEKNKILVKSNSLKNIENNFFIFINDVLQEPLVAYNYLGGRVVFTEPPKEGSKCSILFFTGSIDDSYLIVPNQSIKDGDEIKLENSEFYNLSIEQSERIVKRLISVDSLDTFPYTGFGITSRVRPVSWTKQKNDRIINGSLISKSRLNQKSKAYPAAKLIKNVETTDTEIYVDNAYPLFIELDNGAGGLTEEKRNVRIIEDNNISSSDVLVNVSGTSTIKSIDVINVGSGYNFTPIISISSPAIKDPLYVCNYTSGISTSSILNSIAQGDIIISVGNSNTVAISTNLIDWTFDSLNYTYNTDLQSVNSSHLNSYVAVGKFGKIFSKLTKDSQWIECEIKTEVFVGNVFQGLSASTYNGTFNDIIYNENSNSWIAIGDSGKIYTGVGVGATIFVESISQSFDYNAIAQNSNVMVAVGNPGISTSHNGKNWFNSTPIEDLFPILANYHDIIWNGEQFIVTSDVGIFLSADDVGTNWNLMVGSPTNLVKILKYDEVYIGLDNSGKLYSSFSLVEWEIRDVGTLDQIVDIKNINVNSQYYPTLVGYAGTISYTIPDFHKGELTANIINEGLDSITILDGGFGYSLDFPPNVIFETPVLRNETLFTINAIGDFGTIVGIHTSNSGIGTTTPSISFELVTDYSDSGYESLNQFGITYSQLSIGDYFIINNSNVKPISGYALTGITASLGGMSNYPESRVGTATSYIDGVYRVEFVQSDNTPQGIVTVTCNVVPIDGGIGINTNGITTSNINANYYGNYSWSKIINYEDRLKKTPLNFSVNTNDGLIGLNTAPTVQRIPPLIF